MNKLYIKRIYEKPAKTDGFRIFIDRLWPRGIKKTEAHVDLWLKEIAPSNELRKFFGHDPEKWAEFKKRYTIELKNKKDLLATIHQQLKKGTTTLLYAAKDTEHNNAAALKDYLAKLKI